MKQNKGSSMLQLRIAVQAKCDYFVTTNEEILDERDKLELHYGIKIRTPKEMVENG